MEKYFISSISFSNIIVHSIWLFTVCTSPYICLENASYNWLINAFCCSESLQKAFSPYQVCTCSQVLAQLVFVCVFMCPTVVSQLLALSHTQWLTDTMYVHTDNTPLHTHRHTSKGWKTNGPCWHTDRDVDKLLFHLNAQPNRKPQLHLSLSVRLH